MNTSTFQSLSVDDNPWFCNPCLRNQLPLMNVTLLTLDSLNYNSCTNQKNEYCNVCNKIINSKNSMISCHLGKHKCHLKCVNLTSAHLKSINKNNWCCDSCNPFPFNIIDNTELLSVPSPQKLTIKFPQNINSVQELSSLPQLELESPEISLLEKNVSVPNFKYYDLKDFHNTKKLEKLDSNYFLSFTLIYVHTKNFLIICIA